MFMVPEFRQSATHTQVSPGTQRGPCLPLHEKMLPNRFSHVRMSCMGCPVSSPEVEDVPSCHLAPEFLSLSMLHSFLFPFFSSLMIETSCSLGDL